LTNKWDGYGSQNVERDIGNTYSVMLWQETEKSVQKKIEVLGAKHFKINKLPSLNAIEVEIPIDPEKEGTPILIHHYIE
jgi:hypothetical protein